VSSVARLPAIAEPPHDPRSLPLAASIGATPAAGFRIARLVRVQLTPDGECARLVLGPNPAAARRFDEANGSFGGLRLPGHVGLTRSGEILLLDRSSGVLKRFDPCRCSFEPLLRLGPSATAIAIGATDLFVADPAQRAVLRFAIDGFVPRLPLRLPHAALRQLAPGSAYAPIALAIDGRGCTYAADAMHGRIDRFASDGRWLGMLASPSVPGPIAQLAIDNADRLYALTEGPSPRLLRFEGEAWAELAGDVAALQPEFAALRLRVDATARLDLRELCVEACNASGIFDAYGGAVPAHSIATLAPYAAEGTYTSLALDSGIERCVWHRVVLHAEVPKNASIEVQTTSAQIEWSAQEVDELPDHAWQSCAILRGQARDLPWDCLVRSPRGRYAWLRLVLRGDGGVTAAIARIEVEFPRISLRRFLPAVFGADPASADFTDRFLALFDTSLRSIERQLDTQARLFDPLSAPVERPAGAETDFLTWLGTWVGVALDRHWPEARRRELLKHAGADFGLRGTRIGLQRMLARYLQLTTPCECARPAEQSRCVPLPRNCAPEADACCARQLPELVLEHFRLRRWLRVGAGRLGDESVLWGKRIVNRSQLDKGAEVGATRLDTLPDPARDPLLVHANRFSVFVPARIRHSAAERKGLENLLRAEAPAHTAYDVRYVEPRFRVGVQAMIGFDAVVARTPQGVSLGDAKLRQGSVLTGAPGRAPGFRVGARATPSITTKLT
jgi:phage tail-like protein